MARNRTTISDIAKALDVTSSTVSRALNDHPGISLATKKLVLEKAKQLDYRPNHLAAALRNGRSKVIGVIIPVADRSFFSAAIRGIEDEAVNKGYGVIVCQAHNDIEKEQRAIDTLVRSQVEVIISSVTKSTSKSQFKNYQKVIDFGIPVIFFDRIIEKMGVNTVVVDDFSGAYQATQHLIDQGYKRIAHFAGDFTTQIYKERLKGYQEALIDNNYPLEKELIIECSSNIELGKTKTNLLFNSPNPPDAIFSSSDFAALGALQQLKALGKKVPEEVGIIGFANEPFSSFVEPSLSSVNQFSRELGKIAAQIFFDHVKRNTFEQPIKQIVLQPKLMIRNSSVRQKIEPTDNSN